MMMIIKLFFLTLIPFLVGATTTETQDISIPSYQVHRQAKAASNNPSEIKSKVIVYVPLAQPNKLPLPKKNIKTKKLKRK